MLCVVSADVPLPGVVHGDVTAGALQQLLLCLSFAGHRHGREDAAHHPVLRHAQRQTGNSNKNAIIIIKEFDLYYSARACYSVSASSDVC